MKKKKNAKSKNIKKNIKSKSTFFGTYRFLPIAVFLLFLLGIVLIFISKQPLTKRYDPGLEKKLDMKSIPSDVKEQVKKTPITTTLRVPILLYHYVEYVKDKKDTIRQSLNIIPSTFENQIQTLQSDGYTFITMRELGSVLDGSGTLPSKPIVLTFDDGHRDFYTDIYPLLKKYNIKVTAYIVPGFLGGTDFMDPDQVQEISDSGLVEIGAHTINHAYLKNLDISRVKKEVAVSKIMLQDEFHVPVVSFAYPYGAFDQQAIDVVKESGFSTAVSTLPGIEVNQSNRYFIQRIRPGALIGDRLINFLEIYKQPIETSTKAIRD